MSPELEARIARLEDEVQQLRTLLQSLNLGQVENDLVLRLDGQIEVFNLTLANVANNATFTLEPGTKVTTMNTTMENVGNNVDVTASAATVNLVTAAIGNNVDITTGGGAVNIQTGDIAGGVQRM